MYTFLRTDSGNQDFISLVYLLDMDLAIRDGADHAFYAQFNKIDLIKQVIVAYAGGLAVGCGSIKFYDSGTGEVKRMYVRPEFRGLGIAGGILKELESWARELNFEHLILETGKAQPEAIGLYAKSGFVPIPNYGQYESVENSVCMKKKISAHEHPASI